MSYEVDKRRFGPRNVARRGKKPTIAIAVLVLIMIDSVRLHLLHHLLGAAGGPVAVVLFIAAAIWAAIRLWRL